mmetsp:Transcript_20937/g.52089  ORF Transcript_20937/g.52089 Transcript_20937/m.52089 type:complete len:507 (+) Transcript_20937:69-1589(+)
MDDASLEKALLLEVSQAGAVQSDAFAATCGVDHKKVIGLMKSLEASELVASTATDQSQLVLTPEALTYLTAGSPEAQAFAAVPAEGCTLAEFKAAVDVTVGEVGFKQAMQVKWLGMVKGAEPRVERKVDAIEDTAVALLAAVAAGTEIPAKELENLVKKRKLVKQEAWKSYSIAKGAKFALERVKAHADLTKEMMADGSWRKEEFKAYNLVPGAGAPPAGGHVHPLLKVRQQFREIFLQLGFAEMPTNNFIESGFWNFDTLIQPQMHPARDAHDTFFMKTPAMANRAPEDYLDRVRTMHEVGGHGSIGHQYSWKRAEADKNILRTHTTAVSARCLHKLAQDGFKPAKFFSIDRVFRNEAVDRTHLAEFHQVEGVICDKNLTLGDLIGVLHQFFARLGMTQLRFKPAFNPYTEPSMEIFAYHPMLKKWVEVGNSGMFRPEMLIPMGMPEDVNVIAWGLSLERPTMIMYGIDNIRDLFGSKMQVSAVKNNPICRLGLIEQAETVKMTQ